MVKKDIMQLLNLENLYYVILCVLHMINLIIYLF